MSDLRDEANRHRNALVASEAVGASLRTVAAATGILGTVVAEARALTDSLSSLSVHAEAAVKRVRELDAMRSRIQMVRMHTSATCS